MIGALYFGRETVLEGGGEGKEGWCPRPLGLGPLPMNGTFPRVGGHGLEAPRSAAATSYNLGVAGGTTFIC